MSPSNLSNLFEASNRLRRLRTSFELPPVTPKSRQQSRPCAKHPSRASPSLVVSPRVTPILVLRFEAAFELRSRHRTSEADSEPRILEQTSRKPSHVFVTSSQPRLYIFSHQHPVLDFPRTPSILASSLEVSFELRKLLRTSNRSFELRPLFLAPHTPYTFHSLEPRLLGQGSA